MGSEVRDISLDTFPEVWGMFKTMCGYPIATGSRGKVVIISNTFLDSGVLAYRPGNEIDQRLLACVLKYFGFEVEQHTDVSDTEMRDIMERVASQDHSQYDSFVCCILSHGRQGKVYGNNGKAVPIEDLTSAMKPQYCPSLAGKPKLFFVQACQGNDKQKGFRPMDAEDIDVSTGRAEPTLIPEDSDFLLSYSTVPGYESYRSPSSGSVFIQTLAVGLMKYGHRFDIQEILLAVNNSVASLDILQADGRVYKQSPAFFSTLRKKFFFKRPLPFTTT
ncbi:caspase-7-like [Littorina saxatilis]|uniref:caspase-7-like n=1 Tax=Littorina saxatilis TaxID=31220 RepID=UPI0038B5629A